MGLFDLFDDVTDTKQSTRVDLRNMDELNQGQGAAAEFGSQLQMDELKALRDLITGGGIGQAQGDIAGARQESMTLIDMLRNAQAGPSRQNIAQAQNFANQMFAPQEQAMQTQFRQAETDTSRLAARLGRQVNDPILRAKLAQSQADMSGQLQAQKGAFAAQSAFGMQQQGLDLQGQLMNVRGGLASQALQNRQTLLGLGQSLLQQERQFRLGAAGQTTTGQTTQQGGFGDVMGAIGAGAGTIAKLGFFGPAAQTAFTTKGTP